MVPIINERISRLFEGFDNAMRADKAIVLNNAFSSLAGDIVIQQLFGEHYDFVGNENFESPIPALFQQFTDFYHLARFIPGLLSYLRRLPVPFIRLISPSSPTAKDFYYRLRDKVNLLSKDTELKEAATMISMLLNNTAIEDEERSPQRVFDEALIFVGAGAETLSRAMRVGFFHLLNDKLILARLRQELRTLPPPQEELYVLSKLEGLTYLQVVLTEHENGVVHEALRLSFGPISRRPRIATEEILHYDTWAIPAGILTLSNPNVGSEMAKKTST
ncbi:hypothetical protein NW762_005360 [Fusarium torreyae]|uniref:Cytochrome P450 n=1 Tax=Fusarium torreyae TaxID=1237075 RepID=A0A9W8VJG1_9HYPO|nr:hypothetical protein NW762_005360 [Fusarium torreyae]